MTQASAERSWNVALRAQAEDALEIAVFDVIGKGFFGDGVDSKDILGKLRAAPKAKTINLRINSVGGLVDEAKAMVNLLGERAAAGVEIVGWVDGIAASSAAFLLTAAKRVVMPANTFQMLHGVRAGIRGTAEEVEAGAVVMRRTNEQIAEAFASASARRGKGKTKEDFLAAFAAGDLYLDADEAIAWGLADEKLEALKIAACLADLSGIERAPQALLSAHYVTLNGVAPAPQPDPPAREGHNPAPRNPQQESRPMSQAVINLVAIATVLGFTAEAAAAADEQAITGTIQKLKTSARIGGEIEKLVNASGDQAVGAVRALLASRDSNAELGNEVAKLKTKDARRDFEGARDGGLKAKKLTPAVAQLYTTRFENCLKDESLDADARADRAMAVVEDLRGFLNVAPRIASQGNPPAPSADGGADGSGPVLHNGKAFEDMRPVDRKHLKDQNVDLYNTMREDAVARGAI
jgi:ATP-dependent protease ClpP protease subunit